MNKNNISLRTYFRFRRRKLEHCVHSSPVEILKMTSYCMCIVMQGNKILENSVLFSFINDIFCTKVILN